MFKKSIIIFITIISLLMLIVINPVVSQISWTTYDFDNTGGKLGSNQVYAVAVDPNSEGKIVWFGGRPNDSQGWVGGLAKFNTETGEWILFTTSNSELPHNRIWDIDFDADGNIWIGTHGGGLAKLDALDNWTVYNNSNTGGKLWDNVYEIAIDPWGNLWCSGGPEVNDVGLSVFDRVSTWAVYSVTNSSLSQNQVYAIAFGNDGKKWFGTRDNGVDQLDDKGTPFDLTDGDLWTHYSTSNGLSSNNINSGAGDWDLDGNAWFGFGSQDNAGCNKFDGNTWTKYLSGQARIRCIVHDAQGNVWLGDKGGSANSTGLWKFDGNTWVNWTASSTGQPIDWINKIAIDEKNSVLWIGTDGNGAVKVEGLITPSSVDADKSLALSNFNLTQNYPNPFNPETAIQYSLDKPQHVRLSIYNLNGQLIRIIENGDKLAGAHTVSWDGKDENGLVVSSGVYLYRIETEHGHQAMRKAILLK
jgi:ligand-binding sensor domain-containing protein